MNTELSNASLNEHKTCSRCAQACVPNLGGCGTGYAQDSKGNVFCYTCVAEEEKRMMREDGKIGLYLVGSATEGHEAVNWPGTLRFKAYGVKTSPHNIARTQTHFRFTFEGQEWSGVIFGDSQLARCRRLRKQRFH